MSKYERIDTDSDGVKKFYDNKFRVNGWGAFCMDFGTMDMLAQYVGAGMRVLDAGCGSGCFMKHLQSKVGRSIGIDISEEAVKVGQTSGLQISLGNVENLPFEDGEFDVVYCLGVLEHLVDMVKGFSELKRVALEQVVILVPVWEEGIEKSYEKESLKNIERWYTVEEWKSFFGQGHVYKELNNGDLLVLINKEYR